MDAWNHSKTSIFKICAHAAHYLARAINFNIAYDTLH